LNLPASHSRLEVLVIEKVRALTATHESWVCAAGPVVAGDQLPFEALLQRNLGGHATIDEVGSHS
jgi:hypothetical protein